MTFVDHLKQRRHALRTDRIFDRVEIRDGVVRSPWGGGPVHGARATVETAGAINRRITLTRMATTGVLALAWRKKQDDRDVHLVIEGDGWAIVRPIDAKHLEAAHRFATRLNLDAAQNDEEPASG